MKLEVSIQGLKDLSLKLDEDLEDLEDRILFGIESNAKVLIQTSPSSGRTYKRGKTATHQAAAPGEPPATDTGFLVNAIQTFPDRKTVEVAAVYGSILEGSLNRPFMVPAITKTLNEL